MSDNIDIIILIIITRLSYLLIITMI